MQFVLQLRTKRSLQRYLIVAGCLRDSHCTIDHNQHGCNKFLQWQVYKFWSLFNEEKFPHTNHPLPYMYNQHLFLWTELSPTNQLLVR